MPAVAVEHLSAGYGGRPVLEDMTLAIGEGRICALIGHNGSGKTTLMRCINAILKPMRGRVVVKGRDVARLRRLEIARLISMVPQSSPMAFGFRCLDMVLMGAAARTRAWSAPGPAEVDRARQVCAELDIGGWAHRPFNRLSGGEKQLVILARALYQDAPVMLLDEPNAHLDFCNQHRIMARVRRLVKQRGVTAVVTLHDPNLALHYCDDVVLLRRGRLVGCGPTHEMMRNDLLRAALGDNLATDTTVAGRRVVVARERLEDNGAQDRLTPVVASERKG